MKDSNRLKKISVLEPGAWGTALGILLSRVGNKVNFWYRNPALALKLFRLRENERLPGVRIPKEIFISSKLKKVTEKADLIIVASPSFNFRKTLLNFKESEKLPPLLGIAKGIEKETLKLPSQIVEEILGSTSYLHLSGPGFAKEIVRGKPAKEVIACRDNKLLKYFKELFEIKPLIVSTSEDLLGVQLAGALKNTLSIGISLVEAKYSNQKLREGLTFLALEEMARIGQAMGARKETFFGPAGRGDLILTSTNPLSRNFRFGRALLFDKQKLRKEVIERKITVEGFDTAFALYQLGKIHKLNLPMITEIYKVIYENVSPEKTIENLINLTKK